MSSKLYTAHCLLMHAAAKNADRDRVDKRGQLGDGLAVRMMEGNPTIAITTGMHPCQCRTVRTIAPDPRLDSHVNSVKLYSSIGIRDITHLD